MVSGNYYLVPPRHTHEKVDRDLFTTIGNLKTIKDCEIPDKFPKFVMKSFKQCPYKPLFRKNPLIWDWKSYFGNNVRSIKNLTGFRAFLVKCDGLDEQELFYKKHMLELTWLGFERSLIQGL
jgi:hypothetical protein